MSNLFNIIALDKDYNILQLMRFTNLQWNRKYYEAGTFSVQIPLQQYNADIKFIYTKDRPEVGKIEQVNYMTQNGYKFIQLSGHFLEKELDKHVVFPYGITNTTTSPSWIEQTGKADDVAFAFFEGFKRIGNSNYVSDLGITAKPSKSIGNVLNVHRETEQLGKKIYSILELSEMSYKVDYDFVTSQKTIEFWKGLDRTEDNSDGNNPVKFSTRFGNIKDPNVLIDETNYKNAIIAYNEYTQNDSNVVDSRINYLNDETEKIFEIYSSSINRDDFSNIDQFHKAVDDDALNEVSKQTVIINVEFDALTGSYNYMQDFDLGDKCDIDITEIALSAQARLIGCYEVIKSGVWNLTLEFGTPVLKR